MKTKSERQQKNKNPGKKRKKNTGSSYSELPITQFTLIKLKDSANQNPL